MSYQYVDAAVLPSESTAARGSWYQRACLQGFLVLTLAAALLVVLVQPSWETSHEISSLAAAAAAENSSDGREEKVVAEAPSSPHSTLTSPTSSTLPDASDSNKSSSSNSSSSSNTSVPSKNKTHARLPLLYCLAVVLPEGHQPALMQALFQKQLSLFACDGYEVYSSVSSLPGVDFPVHKVPGYERFGNEDELLQVMMAVVARGRYIDYDWTVKVDPETVFLPVRLQHLLAVRFSGEDSSSTAYLETCNGSELGLGSRSAVEVISATALGTFEFGEAESCDQSFGDPISMHACLQRLEIKKVVVDNLLSDASCEGTIRQHGRGCSSGAVAFHPFADEAKWLSCFAQATQPASIAVS